MKQDIKPTDLVYLIVLFQSHRLTIPCNRQYASNSIRIWSERQRTLDGTHLISELYPAGVEIESGDCFNSVAFKWSEVIALYVVEQETLKPSSEKLVEVQQKLVDIMTKSEGKIAEMIEKKIKDERRGEEWRGDE